MSAPRISYRCASCGSSEVRQDAYAAWNDERQAWEIVTLFDNADCEDCGGECNLREVRLP